MTTPTEILAEIVSETEDRDQRTLIDQEKNTILLVMNYTTSAIPESNLDRIVVKKEERWLPSSGVSFRPGHVRFNLGALFEVIVSTAAAAVAATTSPPAAILAGILVIRSLVKCMEIQLTEDDALVIWAMWKCDQKGIPLQAQSVISCVNAEIESTKQREPMQASAVEAALDKLVRLSVLQNCNGNYIINDEVIVTT